MSVEIVSTFWRVRTKASALPVIVVAISRPKARKAVVGEVLEITGPFISAKEAFA